MSTMTGVAPQAQGMAQQAPQAMNAAAPAASGQAMMQGGATGTMGHASPMQQMGVPGQPMNPQGGNHPQMMQELMARLRGGAHGGVMPQASFGQGHQGIGDLLTRRAY